MIVYPLNSYYTHRSKLRKTNFWLSVSFVWLFFPGVQWACSRYFKAISFSTVTVVYNVLNANSVYCGLHNVRVTAQTYSHTHTYRGRGKTKSFLNECCKTLGGFSKNYANICFSKINCIISSTQNVCACKHICIHYHFIDFNQMNFAYNTLWWKIQWLKILFHQFVKILFFSFNIICRHENHHQHSQWDLWKASLKNVSCKNDS